jgi:hypothetical protein
MGKAYIYGVYTYDTLTLSSFTVQINIIGIKTNVINVPTINPPIATAPSGANLSRPIAAPWATGNIPADTAKAVISTGLVRILIASSIASLLFIPALICSMAKCIAKYDTSKQKKGKNRQITNSFHQNNSLDLKSEGIESI